MSKTKLLAAAVLAGAMTVTSVGTQYSAVAQPQVPSGGGPGVGAPGGEGPKGKGPSGGGTAGKAPSVAGGGGGGGMGGFGSLPAPKVEYRYQKSPDGVDKFKSLLTQFGNDGWEYVGTVPGQDELIFKRIQRSVMGGGVMGGPGGALGAGGGFGGFGGMPGGFGGGPGFPGGGGFSGFGGGGGLPPGGLGGPPGGGPGVGAPPPGGLPPGPGGPPGMPPGLPGGEGGPAGSGGGRGKTPETLDLKVGETVRHQKSSLVIERVLVKEPKVAEVTLDPTDAKRVIIKSLAPGRTDIELTDAGGTKQTLPVRVR